MTFNWDNIRYIFQIPLEWFKRIHDRVFKAYGTNFIRVKEDPDSGGTWIDVDDDAFEQAVKSVAGGGDVKSVDGVFPDQDGDVPLNSVRTINDEAPDQDGNIDLSYVKTVNSTSPDSNGNVNVDTGVMTINGNSPGQGGAITLNYLDFNDWMNANSLHSVCPYVYSNTAYNGTVTQAITNIYSFVGMLAYQDLDSYITALGYLKSSDLSDYVTFQDLSDELENYVTNTTLQTTLADYPTFNDLGDLAYLDDIEVDGHASNAQGVVDFGLYANKWMKTDASGHIATTDDVPVTVNAQQDGYLYADNGQLTYLDEDYVTTDTIQTITQTKYFNATQHFRNANDTYETCSINGPTISLLTSANASPYITFQAGTSATNTATIMKTSTQLGIAEDGILELSAGSTVNVRGTSGICLYAPANAATLANAPNSSATSLSIATVGYINDNCITIDKTQYTPVTTTTAKKVITSVSWNGTVLKYSSENWSFKNGVLVSITSNADTTIDTPVAY